MIYRVFYINFTNDTVEFESGNWIDEQTFTIEIDGLSYGTYEFNLISVDVDGNKASDIVIVNITDGTIPTLTSPADITFNEGSTGKKLYGLRMIYIQQRIQLQIILWSLILGRGLMGKLSRLILMAIQLENIAI